ncbi:hypothetical protein WA026_006475 [Henosepilachna vigintioctopunctata]|uniref:L antigen family member 3 n=1 Tax=Henosepilachna vigintioctopunctata TaxID=420089 RepID=A0AAW1U8Z0_9CUCU
MSNKCEETTTLCIEIPFPSSRLAEVALHSLRVDTEPKRGGTTKTLEVVDNKLITYFAGSNLGSIRVSVNSFFDNIHIIKESIQLLGEPVSEHYSYLNNA